MPPNSDLWHSVLPEVTGNDCSRSQWWRAGCPPSCCDCREWLVVIITVCSRVGWCQTAPCLHETHCQGLPPHWDVDNLLFYLTHVAITWEACYPKFQRGPSTVTRPKRALSGHYSLTGKRWEEKPTKRGVRCDCWESYSSSSRLSWFYMAIYAATHHLITKSSLSKLAYS